MKDATRVSQNGSTRRRYGPLLKLAARIATETDGLPCSVKTVYAVKAGRVTSARVAQALQQAEKHPEYVVWRREHRRQRRQQFEDAKRRLLEAEGRAA